MPITRGLADGARPRERDGSESGSPGPRLKYGKGISDLSSPFGPSLGEDPFLVGHNRHSALQAVLDATNRQMGLFHLPVKAKAVATATGAGQPGPVVWATDRGAHTHPTS